VRFFAAIAIAAAALALTGASSTAGAAHGVAQHRISFLRHHAHMSQFAPTRQAKNTARFRCVSSCSSYESTINQYFTDVAAASANNATDNVYSVATQYSDIQYGVTFDASTNTYIDGTPYPTTATCQDGSDTYCVTDTQLQAEIAKVIAKKKWPTSSTTALYFIFTPANVGVCIEAGAASGLNPCTTNFFCAYHSESSSGFIYAVEPDAAAIGNACTTFEAPAGNGADDTLNTISHEHNEAITDPFGDGWVANDGPGGQPQDENGDLCAYDFGTALGTTLGGAAYNQVINGHDYYLQLEYSNQDGGCVPYLGGPVTANDPTYGVGPLVLQNPSATVMTTNTVYAIYWVPAPPVNSRLPTIFGTPKVGNTLRARHGAWSNAPKFTYRWLRCTRAGRLCKTIPRATRFTYRLVKADKGHRLEVRVWATNMAGRAAATSAPTLATRARHRTR
jgi:hypothetical protein